MSSRYVWEAMDDGRVAEGSYGGLRTFKREADARRWAEKRTAEQKFPTSVRRLKVVALEG